MGELHLEIIVDRMKREFGVEATTGKPQVAYRETIQGTADVEYKHIKQTGGRGQYGHVKIKVKPLEPIVEGEKIKNNVDREDHFEFINNIKGGVIPQEYIQPVRKGIDRSDGARHSGRLPSRRYLRRSLRRQLPRCRLIRNRLQTRRHQRDAGSDAEGEARAFSSRS